MGNISSIKNAIIYYIQSTFHCNAIYLVILGTTFINSVSGCFGYNVRMNITICSIMFVQLTVALVCCTYYKRMYMDSNSEKIETLNIIDNYHNIQKNHGMIEELVIFLVPINISVLVMPNFLLSIILYLLMHYMIFKMYRSNNSYPINYLLVLCGYAYYTVTDGNTKYILISKRNIFTRDTIKTKEITDSSFRIEKE